MQFGIVQRNEIVSLLFQEQPSALKYLLIFHTSIKYTAVEPRLSGLIGTTRNSPDNRGSG